MHHVARTSATPALFNLVIDTVLRGCEVENIRVGNMAPGGNAIDRAAVQLKKKGHPAGFEITERTFSAHHLTSDLGPK
jgi:hypothetical protein